MEELIRKNPDLIKKILEEVIEDIAMERAIEEGLKTKDVSKEEIMEILNS